MGDVDTTADTYSLFEFVYNPDGNWELHSAIKGLSIT